MFSAKKIILIAVIAIILIAIPVTVYVLQQQLDDRSHANPATTLSFTPLSTTDNPIQLKKDEIVDLDVIVEPSTNVVSFIKLEFQYDNTKLATPSSGAVFEVNEIAKLQIKEGPVLGDGKITINITTGFSPTDVIRTRTKVGTLHLQGIAATTAPTRVIFGTQSQIYSQGSGEDFSTNVLSSSVPAIIAVVEPTDTEEPTPEITDEPTPEVTEEPTPEVTDTPIDTPTPTIAANNQLPVCTSLLANSNSGTAPLLVNFTASGNDPDGTISKIDFNFGDGSVGTKSDGLATASVSAQLDHTYTSGGTFTASAILTDNSSTASASLCNQTITVAGPSTTPSATLAADTPTPTLASPGPGATIIGLGAFFTVLSVIGAILFFAL